MTTKKFHVYKNQDRTHRTTISIDNYVWQLLALKLGYDPSNRDSHKVVRQWLQDQLDKDVDPKRNNTSQWLQAKAVLEITDKQLIKKYRYWIKNRIRDGKKYTIFTNTEKHIKK